MRQENLMEDKIIAYLHEAKCCFWIVNTKGAHESVLIQYYLGVQDELKNIGKMVAHAVENVF